MNHLTGNMGARHHRKENCIQLIALSILVVVIVHFFSFDLCFLVSLYSTRQTWPTHLSFLWRLFSNAWGLLHVCRKLSSNWRRQERSYGWWGWALVWFLMSEWLTGLTAVLPDIQVGDSVEWSISAWWRWKRNVVEIKLKWQKGNTCSRNTQMQ